MEVFILANGGVEIGMGHILRSLMIVKELKILGIQTTYISFDNDKLATEEVLKYANHITIKKNEALFSSPDTLVTLIKKTAIEEKVLLHIDSDVRAFYLPDFQKGIVNSGIKLMYATLYNEYYYYAHILLNQNILALSQEYSTEVYTKRLLGPKYFLWSKNARNMDHFSMPESKEGISVFINFGNSDPNNLTAKAVQLVQLNLHLFEKVIVVVGSLYSWYDELKEQIKDIGGSKLELKRNVSNMYDLMRSCNLGFSSMGLTFWELTYLNIPSIIFSGSTRERPVCEFIGKEGYAYRMGDYADVDWLPNWSDKLGVFLEQGFVESLKFEELKKLVNIRGTELVAKEIAAI